MKTAKEISRNYTEELKKNGHTGIAFVADGETEIKSLALAGFSTYGDAIDLIAAGLAMLAGSVKESPWVCLAALLTVFEKKFPPETAEENRLEKRIAKIAAEMAAMCREKN